MRCVECGAEIDELNESQPVCPGCGAAGEMGADDADVAAVLDDAAAMDTESSAPAGEDVRPDSDEPFEPVRTPLDLQEAFEEAESLLLATGHVGFDLPQGFKLFRLPTDHAM